MLTLRRAVDLDRRHLDAAARAIMRAADPACVVPVAPEGVDPDEAAEMTYDHPGLPLACQRAAWVVAEERGLTVA